MQGKKTCSVWVCVCVLLHHRSQSIHVCMCMWLNKGKTASLFLGMGQAQWLREYSGFSVAFQWKGAVSVWVTHPLYKHLAHFFSLHLLSTSSFIYSSQIFFSPSVSSESHEDKKAWASSSNIYLPACFSTTLQMFFPFLGVCVCAQIIIRSLLSAIMGRLKKKNFRKQ